MSDRYIHQSLMAWQERYLTKLGFYLVGDQIHSLKYEKWQYKWFWLESGTLLIRLIDRRGVRHLIIIPLFFRCMKIFSFRSDTKPDSVLSRLKSFMDFLTHGADPLSSSSMPAMQTLLSMPSAPGLNSIPSF